MFSIIRQEKQDLLHACSILSSNLCHSLPWLVLSQSSNYVDVGPLDIISLLRKSKSRGGQPYWLAWLAQESIDLYFEPSKGPFCRHVSISRQILGQRCFHAIFCYQNLRPKQCEPWWWGSRAGTPWPPASHVTASSAGFDLKRQAFIIATASADEAGAILKAQDTSSWCCVFL